MPWKEKPFGWGKEFAGEALFPRVKGATVAVLDQVSDAIRQDASISEIVFRLDHIEPPSVELAIQLMLDQVNCKLRFSCVSERQLGPDPRESSASHSLWQFVRDKAKPAVDEPSPEFKKACAEIAIASSDCVDSWSRARKYVKSNSISEVGSCIAAMVYPPAIDADFSPVDWVRRIQLAAAQLAVAVEQLNDVPIADSRIADLSRGPIDWSVDAAMVALAQRARETPALIPDVSNVVQDVLARIPDKGSWSSDDVGRSVLRFLEFASSDASAKDSSSSNQ